MAVGEHEDVALVVTGAASGIGMVCRDAERASGIDQTCTGDGKPDARGGFKTPQMPAAQRSVRPDLPAGKGARPYS